MEIITQCYSLHKTPFLYSYHYRPFTTCPFHDVTIKKKPLLVDTIKIEKKFIFSVQTSIRATVLPTGVHWDDLLDRLCSHVYKNPRTVHIIPHLYV